MYLVVGLGNPGEQYHGTRHNLGFEVVDHFARKMDAGNWSREKKFNAEITKVANNLILVKPLTFMNNSGEAVAAVANFYKIPSENIIIINDDLDIELGHIKIRMGGAAAGHHGVESVIEKLGTDKFIRLRLGIGTKKALLGEHKLANFNAEHFVLETFPPKDSSTVKRMLKRSIEALDLLLEKGLEKAQSQFN